MCTGLLIDLADGVTANNTPGYDNVPQWHNMILYSTKIPERSPPRQRILERHTTGQAPGPTSTFIHYRSQPIGNTTMSAAQYFPLPPELFSHACDTVSERVSRLPFIRGGVSVTGELVGVTMECLNAEPVRALPLSTPRDTTGSIADGLDVCLEQRLGVPGKNVIPILAEVLCSAGITEMTEILDRQLHRPRKAIRLLPPWTWHIASTMAPSVRLGRTGAGAGSSLSWLDMCPVCRTGILDRVVGKQLFGIPRTDFYIGCSHCGAKFIPVGPAFRLVSIASICDPLWKKHLNQTYPPETWAALARGTSPGGNSALRPAIKKPDSPALPAVAGILTHLKDGSLAVPIPGKTLYFRPLPLCFTGSVREDAFVRVQKTLDEILGHQAFLHLRAPVNAKYSRYLKMKTGLFLGQLKERHDPFYREFLNPFGDEKYGTFRAEDLKETEKNGLLIVVVNKGLYRVINSPDPLRTTINNRLGRIGPEDCLLSGDPVRCRINAVLSTNKKEAGLYMHPEENDDERLSIANAIDSLIAVGRV